MTQSYRPFGDAERVAFVRHHVDMRKRRLWGAATLVALTSGLIVGGQLTASAGEAPGNQWDSSSATTLAGPVTVAEYDLGDTAFKDAQSGTVNELRAVVHYPAHLTGKLPVVIQSHGSWYGCTDPDAQDWPCDKGTPYPSYRGYDYLGRALAQRGFVVVSVSADGINMTSFDYGDRARLMNRHLRLLRDLSNGKGPLVRKLGALVGHLDLSDVGTMGHSRGGKGAMWEASDKHAPELPSGVTLKAVLALAPVKFDDPEGDDSDTLITRVPVGVVTSSCDGAVGEAGQEYLDDAVGRTHRPAYSISLKSANHNYYNTQWTPPASLGEDDSTCPAQEITPVVQQSALVTYAVAFYERFLHNDRSYEAVLTGRQGVPGISSTARVVQPVP
jgi:dienelactone hydrolase